MFFGTRTDSTFFEYSPGFYHFPELTLILLFSGTRPESFSVPARIPPLPSSRRILPFFVTDTDSTLFRYSSGKFLGTGTDSTFSEYSTGFYNFPVLALTLPFSDTRRESLSVLAQILPFKSTRPDSTIFRY